MSIYSLQCSTETFLSLCFYFASSKTKLFLQKAWLGPCLPSLPGFRQIFTYRRPIDTRLNRFPNQDWKLFDNASTLNLCYLFKKKKNHLSGKIGKRQFNDWDTSRTGKTTYTEVCRCAFSCSSTFFIYFYVLTSRHSNPKQDPITWGAAQALSPFPRTLHLKRKERKRFAHCTEQAVWFGEAETQVRRWVTVPWKENLVLQQSTCAPGLLLPSETQSKIQSFQYPAA